MKRLGKQTALLLCLLFSAPAMAGLFSKEPQPILLEAKTDRVETLKKLLDNDSVLKDISKAESLSAKTVALGKVHLTILTETSGGARKTNGLSGKSAAVGMEYKLLGITPEKVQAITDKFYADLKKAFASQGYEVLSPEKLLADVDFKEAVVNTKSPEVDSDYIAASAKQTAVPTGILQNKRFTDLSKTLGNIPVIDVDVSLNFAEFKAEGKFLGGDTVQASLAANTRLSINGGHVNVFFGTGDMINMMQFKQTVILPGQIAESVVDKGSSLGDKALTVFSALGGNSYSGKTLEVTVVTNYAEVISGSLQPFAEVVSTVLKKQ